MRLSVRGLAGAGAVLAAALGAAMVPILAPTLAAEPAEQNLLQSLVPPGHAFDPDKLLRRGDNYFSIDIEPGVSGEVSARHTIRKIGLGRTSFVEIVTTPTGTYSSDALGSSYVLYPGVHVERLDGAPLGGQGLYGWTAGEGWTPLDFVDAHSFSIVNLTPDTALETDRHGTCVLSPGVKVCV